MRKIFKFKEVIAIIISIASSLLFIKPDVFTKPDGIIHIDEARLPVYTALFNIIILIIGILAFSILDNDYYLIKRKHGEYEEKSMKDILKISKILNISYDTAIYFTERTSAIIGQLIKNFSLFMWPLIIFYIINMAKDHFGFKITSEFNDNNIHSFLDFTKTHNYDDNIRVFWYLALSALANIFNFISGAGLWICFSILYQKTLDADNKSTLHLGIYYFLLTSYILSYIILLGANTNLLPVKYTILLLDLFCAIFNCVAMILFFNRLVQILYFYQSSLQEKLLDKFYFFIATILLPLYSCFQIFFAVFDQLPDQAQYSKVKSIVFFVCFIGKLFLILFLYSFIKIKWLHATIITLITYEDTPIQLAKNVSAISDSIDSISDDIKDLQDKE